MSMSCKHFHFSEANLKINKWSTDKLEKQIQQERSLQTLLAAGGKLLS